MKKLLIIFPLIFIFCSCSSPTEFAPITANLTFTAVTEINNVSYNLLCNTDQASNLTVTVSEPESNKDFEYAFSHSDITLKYLDLEKKITVEDLSADSPVRIIYEALKAPIKNETADFKISGKSFTIFFAQSGLPLKIEGESLTVIFKGITIKN